MNDIPKFTDIVFSVPGIHGIDDPDIETFLEHVHDLLQKYLELEDGDVILSSHVCNEDGETFHSVKAEIQDSEHVNKMLSGILDKLNGLLKGNPPEMTSWGYDDLPKRVEDLKNELDAHKRIGDALQLTIDNKVKTITALEFAAQKRRNTISELESENAALQARVALLRDAASRGESEMVDLRAKLADRAETISTLNRSVNELQRAVLRSGDARIDALAQKIQDSAHTYVIPLSIRRAIAADIIGGELSS